MKFHLYLTEIIGSSKCLCMYHTTGYGVQKIYMYSLTSLNILSFLYWDATKLFGTLFSSVSCIYSVSSVKLMVGGFTA